MNEDEPDRRTGFVAARLRSFGYAWRGIVWLVLTQGNALVHLAATVAVLVAGFYFKVSAGEWLALVLSMSTVWLAEGLNTAIEALADRITTERDPLIGRAKDVAAGAVLIAAIAAAIVGAIVFWPHVAGKWF
jgi:diacylglycerol kinase (ATP)